MKKLLILAILAGLNYLLWHDQIDVSALFAQLSQSPGESRSNQEAQYAGLSELSDLQRIAKMQESSLKWGDFFAQYDPPMGCEPGGLDYESANCLEQRIEAFAQWRAAIR